jgi:hypothetical protein
MKKVRGTIRTTTALIATTFLFGALLSHTAATAADGKLTADEAKSIAKEAFLWGMHPVAIYHLRYNFVQNEKNPRLVGINRMVWNRTPIEASDRTATTPNATTLYGSAFLDLSKDPAVITVAEIEDHYWSVQLHDNYSRWWDMIGSQFNPPGPVRRLLLGPNWSGDLPDGFVGADIVRSPSDFAGVLARVALTDDTAEELALVNNIQDRITVMSLSDWIAAGRKDVKAEDVPLNKGAYPTYPGMETIREPGKLAGVDYLRWVSLVLNDSSFTKQTDGYQEISALSKFERLGLKAGEPFDPASLSPEIVSAIEEGVEEGRQEALALASEGGGVERNGWYFTNDLDYSDSDWAQRARYGLTAVLAPVPSRSHTPAFSTQDTQGRPLSGEHRYTITFGLDHMPPVTEFWEMPLYDTESYFYDNPINRYSFNSYMLERGKLHTEERQNWLPAPKDGFQLTARFYGAHTPLIDGSYDMPGVVRVD